MYLQYKLQDFKHDLTLAMQLYYSVNKCRILQVLEDDKVVVTCQIKTTNQMITEVIMNNHHPYLEKVVTFPYLTVKDVLHHYI